MVGLPNTHDDGSLRDSRALEAILCGFARAARQETSRDAFLQVWLSGTIKVVGAKGGSICERRRSENWSSLLAVNDRNAAGTRDTARAFVLKTRAPLWSTVKSRLDPACPPASVPAVFIVPLPLRDSFLTIELLFDHELSCSARRSCELFVGRAKEHAIDFFVHERLKTLERRSEDYRSTLEFVGQIHQSLSGKKTGFVIVNKAIDRLTCDRAVLFVRKGKRYLPLAVSGQVAFDPRSAALKALTALAERAAPTGVVFQFHAAEVGDSIPPQIAQELSHCVEVTLACSTAVVPLLRQRGSRIGEPSAVLTVERFYNAAESFQSDDLQLFAEHSAAALENALEHEQIIFSSLRRRLGQWSDLVFPNGRARAWSILAIGLAALMLGLLTAELSVSASGLLQPVERRDVFAPLDALVEVVHVGHGDRVKRGERLLELRDSELDLTIRQCEGDRDTTREKLAAAERAGIPESRKTSSADPHRIAGERDELRARLTAVEERLQLLRDMESRLRIESPFDGEILSWDVGRSLLSRPVRRGQVLLQIADTSGAWEMEGFVEQRHLGHLLDARETSEEPLAVAVRVPSDPTREFHGTLVAVRDAVEYRDDLGHVVPVVIRFDSSEAPLRQSGGAAIAKIKCGKRSLGYVWFHELWESLRTSLWRVFC